MLAAFQHLHTINNIIYNRKIFFILRKQAKSISKKIIIFYFLLSCIVMIPKRKDVYKDIYKYFIFGTGAISKTNLNENTKVNRNTSKYFTNVYF